jgi:hypothetical protein
MSVWWLLIVPVIAAIEIASNACVPWEHRE